MLNRISKSSAAMLLTVALPISYAGVLSPAYADSLNSMHSSSSQLSVGVLQESKNPELQKDIEKVLDKFYFDENDRLAISVSDEQLVREYGFSADSVEKLHAIFEGRYHSKVVSSIEFRAASVKSDERLLYLDNEALTVGIGAALVAAAEVGPAALMAAWTAFSATFSGPIAVGSAVLGAAFFGKLAVKIVGAVAEGKGIAFYATWDLPPLRAEIE